MKPHEETIRAIIARFAGPLVLMALALLPGARCLAAPRAEFRDLSQLAQTNAPTHLVVQTYQVRGDTWLTNSMGRSLSAYTGTNVTVAELVKAASELQREHFAQGFTNLTVAIAQERITNGVAVINVFRGRTAQILISGKRYELPEAEKKAGPAALASKGSPAPAPAAGASSNSQTNAGPRFTVRHYEITGDSLLSTQILTKVLLRHTGTNVGIQEIMKAASDLQMEYRDRGFPTVSVTIPQQQITNEMVKLRVFEGRLSDVVVSGNHYFSSNNVMRALPSLQTNAILSGPVFQAELDRANASRDRQIFPQIQPGEQPNTTEMLLKVKDRFPLHAKVELNNQSSPGTPQLRVNGSAEYDNLWQLEHSLGVQYSFSPEDFKAGKQWNFYDIPLVANYSAFYRMPLGAPEPLAGVVASQPGNFGYDEAARKFRLPPPSNRPELNAFASRSTIDTGLEILNDELIYNVPGVRQVTRQDVQQDLTVNEDIGLRLSAPLQGTEKWRSTLSGGVDFKTYSLISTKTNIFSFTEVTVNANGSVNPPIVSTVASPVPTTRTPLDYLPLSLRYDASLRDDLGSTAFGLGVNFNSMYSGTLANLRRITGSSESRGHWFIVNPSLSRDFMFFTNWVTSVRAEGQWASEPLISTERFGAGGVNNIRGYREGEVFGDTGWHVTLEQKTPPHIIGLAYSKTPLTVRGVVYMDYAETYLLDPNGAKEHVALWGTGVGGVISLGSHWEARLLFSLPLLNAGTTTALQPRFNFGLTGQF